MMSVEESKEHLVVCPKSDSDVSSGSKSLQRPGLSGGEVGEFEPMKEIFEKDSFYYFSELIFLVSAFTVISDCSRELMRT